MLSTDVSTVTTRDEQGNTLDDNYALDNFVFEPLQGMEEPPEPVDPATEVLAEMTEMKTELGEIKTAVAEVKDAVAELKKVLEASAGPKRAQR